MPKEEVRLGSEREFWDCDSANYPRETTVAGCHRGFGAYLQVEGINIGRVGSRHDDFDIDPFWGDLSVNLGAKQNTTIYKGR